MCDIENLGLIALAEKIKKGELTSVQVTEKFIENIEKNKHLNGIIYFDKKHALDEAARLDRELAEKGANGVGRLHGVPLLINDNIHVKGMPNTAGSPALKDFIPKEDAPTVGALRKEGALMLAKANMHELAFGSTTENDYYGDAKCVHNTAYCAGGSSGGTAVGIASKQAPAGLGSDTGGSVRIPSTINAICGLRPSTLRYSQEAVTPMSFSRDTVGPMGKSCEDLELLDEIITGEKFNEKIPALNELKIGIPKGYLCADLDPEIEVAFEKAKRVLTQNGCKLIEVDMDEIKKLDDELGIKLIYYEMKDLMINYLKKYEIPMSFDELVGRLATKSVKEIIELNVVENAPEGVKREDYERLLNIVRPKLINEYKRLFESNGVDLLAYPALPCLAPKLGETKGMETILLMVRNNSPTSNSGIPSLSIPIGKSANNLPIGLHLDASFNRDQFLLKCGALIEKLF